MPISIPPFTNVPSPNDPVASPWAQQLTQFAVDLIQARTDQPPDTSCELWIDTDDPGLSFPNMPRGLVGIRQATASAWTNATAVHSDITVTTGQQPLINAALDPSRWYKATFISLARLTALSRFGFGIFGGATLLYEVLLDGPYTANATIVITAILPFKPLTANATDYKMAGRNDGAVATISINPSAGIPTFYMIEDIGTG